MFQKIVQNALVAPLFLLLCHCGTSSSTTSKPPSGTPAPTAAPTKAVYSGAVKTAIDQNCTGCHSVMAPSGGVVLDTFAAAQASRAGSLDAVKSDRMPKNATLSPADKATLLSFFGAASVQEN